jgi:hypothetical protein
MSTASERRAQIRDRAIGSQDKRVLLVEGIDDKQILQILLDRFHTGWERKWAVEVASKKSMVLEILRLEPDWIGLVDKDEWDEAEQQRQCDALPNLLILPRFCMESYLVIPAELWRAIPVARQAGVGGGFGQFEARLTRDIRRYVRHGVLWHVVTPLWSGLRARGFKEVLASDSAQCVAAVQDDQEILRVLTEWDEYLNPNALFDTFQRLLQQVTAMPVESQLAGWVHGKTFWREVVNPGMNELFGQMPDKNRRKKIFEHLPEWPADLLPLKALLN